MDYPDAPQPTLDQLQLDLLEIKTYLLELSELQKLELVETRRNRKVTTQRLAAVGNRIFQLLLLVIVAGSGYLVYNQLEENAKNKIEEDLVTELVALIVAGISGHQLLVSKKEQKNLDAEEESISKELIDKYHTIKATHSKRDDNKEKIDIH